MEIFLLYGIIGVVWTFYRAFFHFSEPIDELIFKPVIFLAPVFLWVKFKEKIKLQSLGFTKKNLFKNLLIGFGLGLFFALMHLPIAFFVFNYRLPVDLLTYMTSILVLGFADGFVFARTESIFAPIVSHALWNWSVVLFK